MIPRENLAPYELYQTCSPSLLSLSWCCYLSLSAEAIRILIEHAPLIGRVPPSIADSAHVIASHGEAHPLSTQHKGRGRRLRKRDSISGILIHKLNKWRGRGSQNVTPNKSDGSGMRYLSFLHFLSPPLIPTTLLLTLFSPSSSLPTAPASPSAHQVQGSDVLQPSASKRPALMVKKTDKEPYETPWMKKKKKGYSILSRHHNNEKGKVMNRSNINIINICAKFIYNNYYFEYIIIYYMYFFIFQNILINEDL